MPGKNQRKSYLVNREVQMQFAGLLVFVALLTSIQLFASVFILDGNLEQEAAKYGLDQDPVTLSFIIVQQKALLIRLFVFLFVNMLLVGFFGLIFSHRITGPVFAMNRFLKRVSKGDFEGRLTLRKTDQFKEVAVTINEMVESLKNQRTVQLEVLNSLEEKLKQNGGDQSLIEMVEKLQKQAAILQNTETPEQPSAMN